MRLKLCQMSLDGWVPLNKLLLLTIQNIIGDQLCRILPKEKRYLDLCFDDAYLRRFVKLPEL